MALSKKLKYLHNIIIQVYNDILRKNIFVILIETVYYIWIGKRFPSYYFNNFLYRNDIIDVSLYLNNNEVDYIRKKAYCENIVSYLDNKILFNLCMKQIGVPVPVYFGFNIAREFFGIENSIENIESFTNFISLIEILPCNGRGNEIFLKPVTGHQGRGCIRIVRDMSRNELKKYHDIVKRESYIFEQVVDQHSSLQNIYAGSINTVRVLSGILENGKIEIFSLLIRMGCGNNYVDNVSAGGIYIGINPQTKSLRSYGHNDVKYGGKRFYSHPDTDIVFKDYKIPYYDEVIEIVIKAHNGLPYRLVGWDVAITHEGPVMIEGNEGDKAGLSFMEAANGPLKNNSMFKDFLKSL